MSLSPSSPRVHPAVALSTAAIALGFLACVSPSRIRPQVPSPSPADSGPAVERRLLHLSTDKPYYRPGETVYLRGVLLDAFTQAPIGTVNEPPCLVEVRSPKGDIVTQAHVGFGGGEAALGFAWGVPAEQAGGEYRLVAKPAWSGYPEAETTFIVRSYRAPRLKTELDLARKAYGPGDEVTATLVAKRAEGGAAAGAKVTAIARVDGVEVHRSTVALDAAGGAVVRFRLPAEIAGAGEGSLACAIDDGGVVETAAKTLPIVLARVALDLYPEGGDLVAGAPSRLYVEAHTPRGEPADVAGRIVVAGPEGAPVARFRTAHEGRGKVAFTPMPGVRYEVVLDEPAGVRERFAVPTATADGIVVEALEESIPPGAPIRLRVSAGSAGPAGRASIVVARRDRDLARAAVDLAAGETKEIAVALDPTAGNEGVLRVTAFDAAGVPRAERLVFRRPSRALKIEVVGEPGRTTPRGAIAITVRATDPATGAPVANALVGLSAVDDAVLASVEKRDRAPRLPVQALLGAEVKELKDAHVYLDDGPESARALDLLLGTQGWRRFAFRDPAKFLEAHGESAARALALRRPATELVALFDDFAKDEALGKVLILKVELAAEARRLEKEKAMREIEFAEAGAARGVPAQVVPLGGAVPPPAPPAGVPVPMPAPVPDAAPVEPVAKLAEEPAAEKIDDEDDILVGGKRADMQRLRREPWGRKQRFAFAFVREYAHRAAAVASPDAPRTDFAETLYWNAGARTDAEGKIRFTFDAADSVTSFRVRADGVSAAGALGAGDVLVEVRKPFFLEPKLPLEVTAGDFNDAPVAIVNGTAGRLDVRLAAEIGKGLAVAGGGAAANAALGLDPDGRGRHYIPLEVAPHRGQVAVRLRGEAGSFRDDVIRQVPVVPAGFPMEIAGGGRLAAGGSVKYRVAIPDSVEPTSVEAEAAVYPTPLASLAEAAAALLQEPGGCFEQTSATSYPNVMVMRYLSGRPNVDASIVARASELLDRGYKRLVGFECKQGGYEWFGGDPGHEALTAYGVLQFTDMASVYPVDMAMLGRVKGWLLSRRNGKGGYERNARALDSFGGAPEDVTDLYITWALKQAGEPTAGLVKEIARARERGQGANDPYVMALAANILLDAGDKAAAGVVMDRIAGKQAADGRVEGAATSITRSGGQALEIETTSLAILAWLRSPAHTARVEKAMGWLTSACKGGAFGSTQSTVLALRAIVAYHAARATPKAPGTLTLAVNGKVVDEVPFGSDRQGAIRFPAFADALKPGAHEIELRMVGGSEMPYSFVVRYRAMTPPSAPRCKLTLKTGLSKAEVREGETVDLRVELANATDEGLPMAVAIVGLPAGLEARPERLKELVKAGEIDAFETRGRQLVFYRRAMAPRETRKLSIDLVAAIPGRYTGPASRAYLYYTAEDTVWTPGLGVRIERP